MPVAKKMLVQFAEGQHCPTGLSRTTRKRAGASSRSPSPVARWRCSPAQQEVIGERGVTQLRYRARSWHPAGRNPARATRSASVKAGWIVTSAVDGVAVVIGYPPAGLEPGRWPAPDLAAQRKPNV